jgi:hypothetical protein
MKAPAPVRVELRGSPLAGALILVTDLATAALIAWLPVDATLRALAVVGVGGHALWALRTTSLRNTRSAIVSIELGPDRRVVLQRRDGSRVEARVLSDSYVGERLLTLVVRPGGSRRAQTLLLLPDMTAAEGMRRFRVLLRLGRSPGVT